LGRRDFLRVGGFGAAGLAAGLAGCRTALGGGHTFRLATFNAEVTPPLGHPCMGGGIAPAQRVDDPLYARGFVLQGTERPIVLVAVDWCEIRNDAYDCWRAALAAAAQTQPASVFVTSVHQHDAPVADLTAQRILAEHNCAGSICLLDFHEQAVRRVAQAARDALGRPRPITHLGLGQAKVERVASNRRFFRPNGQLSHGRSSSTKEPDAHAAPEGTIDPWLKTLSFWDGDRPVAALSCYATHPMSYYGKGGVSSDFVGLARQRRQADDPAPFQIYATGCSGNVTAGKYNDGSPENRLVLRDRLYQALVAAWQATQRQRLHSIAFRQVPLRLTPRESPGFTPADLRRRLGQDSPPFQQCLAALGLSWRRRVEAGQAIDVPALDFGGAHLLLLPAETYVEYQLFAQQSRPDSFVVVMGFGECGPGYIPIERAWAEGDSNLHDWCWVAPGAEPAMQAAIRAALASKG
jgi:hypothetical protein